MSWEVADGLIAFRLGAGLGRGVRSGMLTLARASSASTDVVVWVGLLIALIIGGGVLVMVLRKRLLAKDDASADVGLFDALKQMRDRGEMTQEEYEAARRKLVEKTKAGMKRVSTKAAK